MRCRLTLLISILCATLGAGAAVRPIHAQPDASISIAHCLDTVDTPNKRDEARCPGFLVQPLKEARQICADAGGVLNATPSADVWQLDVDGDAAPEFVFEYAGNVSCEGAWSVFECGSLGCPKALYRKHDGAWRAIAELWADAPESLELTGAVSTQGYRDLRVGCVGTEPCAEYWYYHWSGEQYERTYLQVRGHRVEFTDSIHGLFGLVAAGNVLAEPASGAAVVGHYGADTEVAIVGTATGTDFYYVSPCNACASGFIAKSAVRPLQP